MASILWPLALPQRLEIGASTKRQKGFIRTPMSIGPAKSRRRFSATSHEVSGTMKFNKIHRVIFEEFWQDGIYENSVPFEWVDPVDFQAADFFFLETPSFSALVGGEDGVSLWRVSMKLEQLP